LVPKNFPAIRCGSAREALELAHRFQEQILVTGSLFLVGETLAVLDSRLNALQISNQ
jgi:folylpolyglutamate synthase/dihydropteroate synthase